MARPKRLRAYCCRWVTYLGRDSSTESVGLSYLAGFDAVGDIEFAQ
jgi:hypothetical protein